MQPQPWLHVKQETLSEAFCHPKNISKMSQKTF